MTNWTIIYKDDIDKLTWNKKKCDIGNKEFFKPSTFLLEWWVHSWVNVECMHPEQDLMRACLIKWVVNGERTQNTNVSMSDTKGMTSALLSEHLVHAPWTEFSEGLWVVNGEKTQSTNESAKWTVNRMVKVLWTQDEQFILSATGVILTLSSSVIRK